MMTISNYILKITRRFGLRVPSSMATSYIQIMHMKLNQNRLYIGAQTWPEHFSIIEMHHHVAIYWLKTIDDLTCPQMTLPGAPVSKCQFWVITDQII